MPDEASNTEKVEEPHARDLVSEQAGQELLQFVNEWKRRWQLTPPEFLWIMMMPVTAYVRQLGMVEREALIRGVK